MDSFKISPLVLSSSDWRIDNPDFGTTKSLVKLYDLKNKLNDVKSQLDYVYKLPLAGKIMRSFDPFSSTKYQIARHANEINVTNAWLKGYELIYHHKLIPRNMHINSFVYFDNASFPGSFILAVNHFIYTLTKIKYFVWNAASLLEETIDSKEPLNDSYKLFKNYPDNWLMHGNNNGDIANIVNISDFQKQFKLSYGVNHAVDLYTCDLGTDVSNNYNAQEEIHFTLNLSQIVCGLAVLKSGGHMVVKHYTTFEPFTISYIALLTNLFKSVEITKPLTSKRTNSEIYIVCKNYLYPFIPNSSQQKIYDLFMERISNKSTKHLINSKYIQKQIADIEIAVSHIFNKQIQSIKFFTYIMKHINDPITKERCYRTLKNINHQIRKKFNLIYIKPIHNSYKLRMVKRY